MPVDVPQPAALAAVEAQRERREEQHAARVAAGQHLGRPVVGGGASWVASAVPLDGVGEGDVDRERHRADGSDSRLGPSFRRTGDEKSDQDMGRLQSSAMPDLTVSSASGTDSAVATADQLATQAGMWAFAHGGNAVDAAIAANAAIAVTAPHLCGLGGDLFALVHTRRRRRRPQRQRSRRAAAPTPRPCGPSTTRRCRSATTSAPSPCPAASTAGSRSTTGSGRSSWPSCSAPAIRLAAHGFPASPLLVGSLAGLDDRGRAALDELVARRRRPGALVRRPGVALALHAIADGGRERVLRAAPFGEGLLDAGRRLVHRRRPEPAEQADWVEPLVTHGVRRRAGDHPAELPGLPHSGRPSLGRAVGLPDDPDDPRWPHVLVEAATAAAFDRPARPARARRRRALVAAIAGRAGLVDPDRASGTRRAGGRR